jgi:hypothetical protein
MKKCSPPLLSTMKSTLFNAYHTIFCTPAQALRAAEGYKTGKINVFI